MFETANTKHIRFNVSLGSGTYYYLTLPYTSNGSSFTITYTIAPLTTGSINYIILITVTITNIGGELVLNMYCANGDGFSVDIEVTDNDNSNGGLCFNDIEVYNIGTGLDSVEYVNCEDVETAIEIGWWEDSPR
jgi:hypothetical protein